MRLRLFCVVLLVVIVHARAERECATCHAAESREHPRTSMARAMESASDCEILRAHSVLSFENAGYSYRIERHGEQSIYTVARNEQSVTVPIRWAFGLGRAGQTYVFEKDGKMYESRVSFYQQIDRLDLTLGAAGAPPKNLLEAAGRLMTNEDSRCFSCHATDAVDDTKLTLNRMTAGIQCERCHGGAEAHVRGFQQGQTVAMKSLRGLSAEDMSNFCGQCHRTWAEIAGDGITGIANIRFQPYRLTNSKCYDSDDARIRCTACHDPHRELETAAAVYDTKCLACHAGGKRAALSCKVATKDCVTCHMPKLELPGSHHQFTDHQIRVVRANAPYPN